MRLLITLMLAMALSACTHVKTQTVDVFGDDTGCMEGPMAQFGQYIGNWNIRSSGLAQDGSGWSDGPEAQWDFTCLGNGTAIQDFWKPAGSPVGTNLRTYNSASGSWDIAWAVGGQPGFAHISATQQDNGEIVMTYISPPQDPPRKITFFPAQANSWKWKLEFSFDGGTTWTEVFRINATRRQ
ncbi:MAG: hypothetical protein HKN70_13430 [Gammaproteobacteria bacterium]|nr:hypothetical protein [Gammaproteobacteria bacterium]